VGSEWPPAMAGGDVVVARPPRLGLGTMQAMLGHPVCVEARVGAREKFRIVGWQRGREEQQGPRRRQWRTTAGDRAARTREEKDRGGL
jgi:hypothetical protein